MVINPRNDIMKINFLPLLSLVLFLDLAAQRQLDIQGDPASTDTVATIKVNYPGVASVVGLAVKSEPVPGETYGTGGLFIGGEKGVWGKSNLGTGVWGSSTSNLGVGGISDSGIGVFGQSSSSRGVWGFSVTNYGVVGVSYSN